jgi:5-methylcytosine-specific restriction protein A
MPRAAKRPCTYPGCAALVDKGRCAKHAIKPKPAKPRSSAALGYGYRWQQLRAAVLREEPNCRACGRPASHVDHIMSKRKGGTDERHNLQALCASCHASKTSRYDHGFGNG